MFLYLRCSLTEYLFFITLHYDKYDQSVQRFNNCYPFLTTEGRVETLKSNYYAFTRYVVKHPRTPFANFLICSCSSSDKSFR